MVFLAYYFLLACVHIMWLSSFCQVSVCENKQNGWHSFYSQWKMQYFKIVYAFKCVLITFLAGNVHFISKIFVQLMYMMFTLLVITKILLGFYRCYGCCYGRCYHCRSCSFRSEVFSSLSPWKSGEGSVGFWMKGSGPWDDHCPWHLKTACSLPWQRRCSSGCAIIAPPPAPLSHSL